MILITGGNGYIGRAIAELLDREGREYRIFDNLSSSNPLNVLRNNFFWGDVRNCEELKEAFRDVDVVFHLAARLPVAAGINDDARDVEEVNCTGTLNVLEMARKHDAKVIFASTCNVYGKGYSLTEKSKPNPLNDYARSKLKAEKLCMEYCENYGLDVIILRIASVYGYSKGVRFNLVANYFVLRALMGYPLTVFGDGSNYRPFIHVMDAAKAFLFFSNARRGEIYNVGSENLKIRELAEIVRQKVNPEVDITFTGDNLEFSYHVSFEKAFSEGFEPEYNIGGGIYHLATKLREVAKCG